MIIFVERRRAAWRSVVLGHVSVLLGQRARGAVIGCLRESLHPIREEAERDQRSTFRKQTMFVFMASGSTILLHVTRHFALYRYLDLALPYDVEDESKCSAKRDKTGLLKITMPVRPPRKQPPSPLEVEAATTSTSASDDAKVSLLLSSLAS